ncbi:hypothetical protein CQW49_08515 [Methylosinus trichosporium OB3b]|uniref:Uncharacterized protein n=2 Tax=Methylocystaceae TaxID=31993 RepID=A0A2D2CYW6_METT3|nr:hypothetical protein CQW49_08515 [Methylosinus trichosporium OB3b]OBS53793.1 hypothetical protein A8B73_04685 [Methylosinus sp. 3S-1]
MRSDEHADDEHVLDDRQAEPTSTLMAAALRRLDEQHLDLDKPALDEPQTGEIAAAAPRGLAEASVETAPSPASMTAAERAEARKRLLERLAALDAAEPDSSRSTAECGSGNGAEGSETDPAATVTAEWDENVPAASADDLREPAEPSAGVERVAKAKGKAKAAKSPAGAFDRLWACYGRKVGKLAAERAFEAALRRGVDPETIIVAAERYAVAFDASGKEAQFRPHLSTWLNGGRYLDEDLPTSPSAGSGMIPADYQPTQDDIAAAFQRGIDVPMMRVAWPRFRDAVRSRSAPPADISAAWRNYCDRLAENMERQRQRDANRPGSIVTAVNELCAEIEGRKLKEVAPSAFGNPGGGLENLDFTGGEADMGKLDFSAGAIDLNATEYRDETRH